MRKSLLLIAVLTLSSSAFATAPHVVDSQYETKLVNLAKESIVKRSQMVVIKAVLQVQERQFTVTGENTQPISYERVRYYKPTRPSVAEPLLQYEVGWHF